MPALCGTHIYDQTTCVTALLQQLPTGTLAGGYAFHLAGFPVQNPQRASSGATGQT